MNEPHPYPRFIQLHMIRTPSSELLLDSDGNTRPKPNSRSRFTRPWLQRRLLSQLASASKRAETDSLTNPTQDRSADKTATPSNINDMKTKRVSP